mmetsp:Transcript_69251/g.132145  ORF Transcript_69251/g.132145 Transcript_69251/m.132145 type:complete len:354 (+) Transcript_69251:78-1139(+)
MLVLPSLLLAGLAVTRVAAVPLLDDCLEATCSANTLSGPLIGRTKQLLQKSLYHASPPEVAVDTLPEAEYQNWQLASLTPTLETPGSASGALDSDAQLQSETMLPLDVEMPSRVQESGVEERHSAANVPRTWNDKASWIESPSINYLPPAEPVIRLDGTGKIRRSREDVSLLEELSPVQGARDAAIRQAAEVKHTEAEIRVMADADVRGTLRLAAKRVHEIIANARKVITAEDRAVHTLLDAVGQDQDQREITTVKRGHHQVANRVMSAGDDELAALHVRRQERVEPGAYHNDEPDCAEGSAEGMQDKVTCGPLNYMTTFGYRLDIFPGVVCWVLISLCFCCLCSLMVRYFAV